MDKQVKLREILLNYLEEGHAHAPLTKAVEGMPKELWNKKIPNVPYTLWELLEHIRISQHDMLDFMVNPDYKEIKWPQDYWPKGDATPLKVKASLQTIKKDMDKVKKITADSKSDLTESVPGGQGQNPLRLALLIIDHNSYHVGEFIVLRRSLGNWKK